MTMAWRPRISRPVPPRLNGLVLACMLSVLLLNVPGTGLERSHAILVSCFQGLMSPEGDIWARVGRLLRLEQTHYPAAVVDVDGIRRRHLRQARHRHDVA